MLHTILESATADFAVTPPRGGSLDYVAKIPRPVSGLVFECGCVRASVGEERFIAATIRPN